MQPRSLPPGSGDPPSASLGPGRVSRGPRSPAMRCRSESSISCRAKPTLLFFLCSQKNPSPGSCRLLSVAWWGITNVATSPQSRFRPGSQFKNVISTSFASLVARLIQRSVHSGMSTGIPSFETSRHGNVARPRQVRVRWAISYTSRKRRKCPHTQSLTPLKRSTPQGGPKCCGSARSII